MNRRRRRILIGCAVLAGLMGSIYLTRIVKNYEEYMPAREVRLICVDQANQPVAGATVERFQGAIAGNPAIPWHAYGGVTDAEGRLRLAVGAHGAPGKSTTYLWGLYSTYERNLPEVKYRLVDKGNVVESWEEWKLVSMPPDDLLDPSESIFGATAKKYPSRFDERVEAVDVKVRVK